jgi:glycolate oxidase iron-sulfur subunit
MGESATLPPSTDAPSWELYSRCIHCGLCLNSCPTYRVLGLEMDSPRGRIFQVSQVAARRLAIGESFVTHIDRCLDCRACETACPSGVEYGRIVERARAVIEREYKRPWLERKLRDFFFNSLLADFKALARWARIVRAIRRSGLQELARSSRLLKLLGLSEIESLAPAIEDNFFFDELGQTFSAIGEKRARVAFLAGCIASVAFAELNRATIRVLQRNGVEVVVPKDQSCCGALHAHAGLRHQARELARQNIRAMLDPAFDAIVTNAAGCGSTMKEYHDLLGEDAEFAKRAREFSEKTKDVTEFLIKLGLRAPQKKLAARVTYQDPCHLAHGQRIRRAPREILEALGCEMVEMPHSDSCCGSAGSYNITQTELSMKILDSKMEDIASVSPALIATANVGCMLQLRAGCKRKGLNADVKHVIELLDAGY